MPSPGGYQHGTPSLPPDPFGPAPPPTYQPDAPPVYYTRREPLLSQDVRYFLGLTGIVLCLAGLLLAAIWGFSTAYQGYVEGVREKPAARQVELATKAFDQKDFEAAAKYFHTALDMSPKSKTGDAARTGLAACYVEQGIEALNSGNAYGAVPYFREALKYDTHSARAHYALGSALYRQGDTDSALSEWLEAARLDPAGSEGKDAAQRAGQIYFNKGFQAAQSGDTQQALQNYTRVLEVAPGSEISDRARTEVNRLTGASP
jgi:tetratricopeptide (TPR) repeat protein